MAIQEIYKAIINFDETGAVEKTKAELKAGTAVETILNEGLIAPMDEVGRKFSEGVFFVPEMLVAAHAMKAGLEILRPHLGETETKSKGRVVIGTVKGDLHDIGKNLVAIMLEGAGFDVVDLGVDVDITRFLDAALENQADIIALSALLTTTMKAMEKTVARIREDGVASKVMVGGAPVTQSFCEKIGADGYAGEAHSAVELARKLKFT